MPVKVKICGLKNQASVLAAIDEGANYLGFVDYPQSSRHIPAMEAAKTLFTVIPEYIHSVIVTVSPEDTWIDQVNFHVSPDFIQLHGNESPERVKDIKSRCIETKIIKAIAVSTAEDIKMAHAYEPYVDMLLFDAKPLPGGLPGGNGIPFDWQLLANEKWNIPWMLSGGLNANNLKEAVTKSGAEIVDVSSGVETSPGVKDNSLISTFINTAKTV